MRLRLYEFPISHYCEKVRWALDESGLPHARLALTPGVHRKQLAAMGAGPQVPVLHDADSGEMINGSAQIVDWIEATGKLAAWIPEDPFQRAAARHWEARLDDSLGPHVRRVCYATLLEHPGLCVRLMAHRSPWINRVILRLGFSKLRALMTRYLDITPESVAQSITQIEQEVAALDEARGERDWLIESGFSRADMTAAALLAPLRRPDIYGVPWPAAYPAPLQDVCDSLASRLSWVDDAYAKRARSA